MLKNVSILMLLVGMCSLVTAQVDVASINKLKSAEFSTIKEASEYLENVKYTYYLAVPRNLNLYQNLYKKLEPLLRYVGSNSARVNVMQKRNFTRQIYYEVSIDPVPGTVREFPYTHRSETKHYLLFVLGTFVPNEMSMSERAKKIKIRGHLVDIRTDPGLANLDKNYVHAWISFKEKYKDGGIRVYVVDSLSTIISALHGSAGTTSYLERSMDEIAKYDMFRWDISFVK